jgi:hypothetical protein
VRAAAAAAAPHQKKKNMAPALHTHTHTAYITKAAAVWPDNRDDNLFFRERKKEPMDKHAKCGGWLLLLLCLFPCCRREYVGAVARPFCATDRHVRNVSVPSPSRNRRPKRLAVAKTSRLLIERTYTSSRGDLSSPFQWENKKRKIEQEITKNIYRAEEEPGATWTTEKHPKN